MSGKAEVLLLAPRRWQIRLNGRPVSEHRTASEARLAAADLLARDQAWRTVIKNGLVLTAVVVILVAVVAVWDRLPPGRSRIRGWMIPVTVILVAVALNAFISATIGLLRLNRLTSRRSSDRRNKTRRR